MTEVPEKIPGLAAGLPPSGQEGPVRHVWIVHADRETRTFELSVDVSLCGEDWDGSRTLGEPDLSLPLCETCEAIHEALCRITRAEFRQIVQTREEAWAAIDARHAEEGDDGPSDA